MNEGLVAATAIDNDLQSDYPSINDPELHDETYLLPPDLAFVGIMDSEPKLLDEAL